MPPSLTKTESEGKTHYHTIQLRGKEEGNYGTVQLILGGNELTGSTVEDFVEGNQLNSDSKYFISQPHYEDLAKQGPVKVSSSSHSTPNPTPTPTPTLIPTPTPPSHRAAPRVCWAPMVR